MVFANDLDRVSHPVADRVCGIVLGTFVLVTAAAVFVSPRTITVTVPILSLAALALSAHRRSIVSRSLLSDYVVGPVIGFLILALASTIWASQSDAPLGPVIKGALYLLCALVFAEAMRLERWSNALHIAEGLWIGAFVGISYLLIEILSNQAIKLELYRFLELTRSDLRPPRYFSWRGDFLAAIAPNDLTRNIAPVTLCLWPSLLSIHSGLSLCSARIAGAMIFAVAVLVVILSEHETSKVALVVSSLIFLMAKSWPALSLRLLRMIWVSACLAVIPLSLAFHRADLQQAGWLQYTARHRVVIWNHTAKEALKSPILGVGAGMMYRLSRMDDEKEEGFETVLPHAHNIYLQTWFELGAIGAALLTLIGLAVLEKIERLKVRLQPHAQATFASAMVMAATSYGMWQPWYIGMFALCAMAFAMARRVSDRVDISSDDNRLDSDRPIEAA
ncbi:MAG: O-antigen ligase family protein [Hyphomicrobium sp.]